MDALFTKIEDPQPKKPMKIEEITNDEKQNDAKDEKQSFDQRENKEETKETSKSSSKVKLVFKIFLFIVLLVVIVVLVIIILVKPSKDEIVNMKKEVELSRKNEAVLKTKLNTYEEQLRRLRAIEKQQRAELQQKPPDFTGEYEHNFNEQRSYEPLPTEHDYENVPDYEPNAKRKPDIRIEQKQAIKELVNKKRDTVADMQAESAAKQEALRIKQEEQIQNELDQKTQSKANRDEKTKEAIFTAVSGGGVLLNDEL